MEFTQEEREAILTAFHVYLVTDLGESHERTKDIIRSLSDKVSAYKPANNG